MPRVDIAAIALTGIFVGWLASGPASPPRASLIDLGLFLVLIAGVGALTLAAGARATTARDRWAWYLLGTACLLRALSGATWRWMTSMHMPVPEYSAVLSLLRCTLEVAGLLLYVSARRQRSDALRHLLDVATVVIGVGVVEWYFELSAALGMVDGGAAKGLVDYAVLLNGTLCALLSALLYLRRGDARLRVASVFLLFAFGMQAVSDSLQWTGSQYEAGGRVTAWWWAVWLLKLGAARAALMEPASRAVPGAAASYDSGVVPYLFLGGASLALCWEMARPQGGSTGWLVIATCTLTALLVVRQMVEQREHAQLSRAIASDRAHFSALVQYSYDAVVLTRGDGGATYVSPTTRLLLGEDPTFERSWGLLAAVHPDEAPALRQLLTQPGDASQSLVCRVRAADGAWHVFALRVVDLRQDPRVGAIAIHGHDITREALLARRLHETVEEEALGVFASGLAHDLNNVLGAISSHVELLLEDVPASSDAAVELRAMQHATARGLRLTRALLALSRRKAPDLEVVGVQEFLHARVPAEVAFDVSGTPARVRIDRTAVGHALDAVLVRDGGADAPPEGWRVSVSYRDVHGEDEAVSGLDTGTYAVIECEGPGDAGRVGAGDPPPVAERPELAAEGAAEDEGLEVLLARAVLREMGGSLTVRDDGDGTRHVTLFLPAERA